MTEKEIAIGLYREGMKCRIIRRKMGITGTQLAEYLLGEPRQPRNMPESRKSPVYKPSAAKVKGLEMLQKNMKPADIHKQLTAEGHKISLSSVFRWQKETKGATNNRIPKCDYPLVRELVASHPNIRGTALSKLYFQKTGRRLDRRAANHWCKKVAA